MGKSAKVETVNPPLIIGHVINNVNAKSNGSEKEETEDENIT